jgi:tripartite-type tricarboxylate transporter receptor subunit TctC
MLKLPRRTFLHLAAGAAALPAMSRIARAQAYPARIITMIVPFAAGGSTDVTARIIAEYMSRALGQQILAENVVGAGGTTGTTRTMRASPNGYTIMMGQLGTHALSVSLYPNLAYRPDVDFAPIGRAVDQAMLIVSRKDFPAKDLREFVPYVKTNASRLNAGHAGVGSITHGTCLMLNSILAVNPVLVPFNGSGPALNALIGSQTDYMCSLMLFSRFWAKQSKPMQSEVLNEALRYQKFRPQRKVVCLSFRRWAGMVFSHRRMCLRLFWTS